MGSFSLSPPTASTSAAHADAIFLGFLIVAGVIVILVSAAIVVFAIRYRSGTPSGRGPVPTLISRHLEVGWTLATLLSFIGLFAWAAVQDFAASNPASPTLDINVVAKQWMWKAEHAGGQREINALHVPVGRAVRLIMQSEDVIHSFYVPAFRIKHDVVPGLTALLWFEATLPGTYPLLCAQFCGSSHSRMTGEVTVMRPEDYARWLDAQPQGDGLVASGATLFRSLGCSGCHDGRSTVRAPELRGLYGRSVPLAGGAFVTADDRYIRDAILKPKAEVVAGYPAVMPSYAGRLSEADLIKLVAFVRSLRSAETAP